MFLFLLLCFACYRDASAVRFSFCNGFSLAQDLPRFGRDGDGKDTACDMDLRKGDLGERGGQSRGEGEAFKALGQDAEKTLRDHADEEGTFSREVALSALGVCLNGIGDVVADKTAVAVVEEGLCHAVARAR